MLLRELARKYGSVSLSPHLPLSTKQPLLLVDKNAGLPAPAARGAAGTAPTARFEVCAVVAQDAVRYASYIALVRAS